MKRLLCASLPVLLLGGIFATQLSAQCEPYTCPNILPTDLLSAAKLSPLCAAGSPTICSVAGRPGFLIKANKSGAYAFTSKFGEFTRCNTIVNPVDSNNAITFTFDPITKAFSWTASSAIAVEMMIVKGGPNANIYNYTGSGLMTDGNVHAPVKPENCKYYDVESVEISYRYQISVTRTLAPTFTRRFNWAITQTVTNNDWRLFQGDRGTSRYAVSLDQTTTEDSNWGINGTVTITNNTPYTTQVLSIADSLQPGAQPIALNCGGAAFTLVPGARVQCTYAMPLTNGNTRNAVLNVTTLGSVRSRTLTTPVVFSVPTATVNPTVTVRDNFGQTWGNLRRDTAWTYDRAFTCANAGTVANTTSIVETGQTASTNVNVQCSALQVTVNSTALYERTWEWAMTQTIEATPLVLAPGQPYLEDCILDLSAQSKDVVTAKGDIVIRNLHPSRTALLTNISALIGGTVAATVSCPASSIPPAGQMTCTYTSALSDNTARTIVGSANLQNYAFPVTGNNLPNGGTRFSGSSDVVLPAAPVEVNACITVFDSVGGTENPLLNLCAKDAPLKWSYDRLIGPYTNPSDCDLEKAEVAAYFRSTNSSLKGNANASKSVKIACQDGCTLSSGYWLTHSQLGPNAYDDNWAKLPDQDGDGKAEQEQELFFLSGETYHKILGTPSSSNPYWALARAYATSELNLLNGSLPTAVQVIFNSAKNLLQTYSAAQVPTLPNSIRKQYTILAGSLDRYNSGTSGPGKCSEEQDADTRPDGIDERSAASNLSTFVGSMALSPNPASHVVALRLSGLEGAEARFTCYNALGVAVASQNIPLQAGMGQGVLDLPATRFPSGRYVCRVQHDGGVIAKMLIVE